MGNEPNDTVIASLQKTIVELEDRLAVLDAQRNMILSELDDLRSRLHQEVEAAESKLLFPGASVTNASSAEEKIALIRRLFHGRDDVYTRRWESPRTGNSGYQPACGNEWVSGLCDKPRVKCAECPHREFLPLTDAVIRNHIAGHQRGSAGNSRSFVIGIYPMLSDETCWFLAADFDKTTWQADAEAFLETCALHKVPAGLERSRSGNGGHVWIFFAEPVSAGLARQLGTFLVTDTMRRNTMIIDDVIAAVEQGRSPVVITERKEHLDFLHAELSRAVRNVIVLKGGIGVRQRKAVAEELTAIPDTEERVIIATGRYLGEGFNDARLDTLFLTIPISWKGTLAQYAGRLHRLHVGKNEVRIYDYADLNEPILARMHDKRLKGDRAIGYTQS